MNNTPDKNKNNYTDYSLNGSVQDDFKTNRQSSAPRQSARPRSASDFNEVREKRRDQQYERRQPVSTNQGTQPRRPLNDEERRRLEAARMAAIQNGGRMSDAEIRRRREEQRYLNSAQPGANPQRRTEIHNPAGAKNRSAMQTQAKRKKNRVRINIGAVIFVLLVAGVIGLSAWQLNREEENLPENNIGETVESGENQDEPDVGGNETTPDETVPDETDPPETEPDEDVNLTLYDYVTVSNGTVDEGNLILVNYDHPYADVDTVKVENVYAKSVSRIKLRNTSVELTADTLAAIDNMLLGLIAATDCNDLMINSGYRNKADQQAIYDDYVVKNGPEYAKAYVANAGYSEHHTGLACDLTFFTDDGYVVSIANHDYGSWVTENSSDYGFILRYPEDKVNLTKIAYESWHFRYVGVPHAYACNIYDFCLEEYIDYLKNTLTDSEVIWLKSKGALEKVKTEDLPVDGSGWLIYYVPAEDGEETDVKLLRGDMYKNYEISGTNDGGFIVTITLP